MVLHGVPLRISVCNVDGICVPVALPRPMMVEGSFVELMDFDVLDFVNAITEAEDELSVDTEY